MPHQQCAEGVVKLISPNNVCPESERLSNHIILQLKEEPYHRRPNNGSIFTTVILTMAAATCSKPNSSNRKERAFNRCTTPPKPRHIPPLPHSHGSLPLENFPNYRRLTWVKAIFIDPHENSLPKAKRRNNDCGLGGFRLVALGRLRLFEIVCDVGKAGMLKDVCGVV